MRRCGRSTADFRQGQARTSFGGSVNRAPLGRVANGDRGGAGAVPFGPVQGDVPMHAPGLCSGREGAGIPDPGVVNSCALLIRDTGGVLRDACRRTGRERPNGRASPCHGRDSDAAGLLALDQGRRFGLVAGFALTLPPSASVERGCVEPHDRQRRSRGRTRAAGLPRNPWTDVNGRTLLGVPNRR